MSLSSRNPFVSLRDEPITEDDLRALRGRLLRYWEDTQLVTKLGGDSIIAVGNLRAVVETALQAVTTSKGNA